MRYTKEGTIEVREDIFNQIRVENDLLTQENVELRNKLELTIRLCTAWEKLLLKMRNYLEAQRKRLRSWKNINGCMNNLVNNQTFILFITNELPRIPRFTLLEYIYPCGDIYSLI